MSEIVDDRMQGAATLRRKRRRLFYHGERVLFVIGMLCLGLAALLFVIDARLPPSMTAQTRPVPALVQ